MANNQRDLVYISFNRWDTIQQRSHHLARRLSQHFRVLYVDPVAYSILGYIRHRLAGQRFRNLRPVLRSISPTLTVFSPPPLLPFSMDSELVNRLDHLLLARMVRRLLRQLKLQQPILWLTFPTHLPLVGALGESLVCYDCMDNYPAFYPPGSRRARLTGRLEQQLVARSDLITATALTLQQRLQAEHAHVYLVRNAVSEQFLACQERRPEPPDWLAGRGPVLGYIGSIAAWLDFEAIRQVAERHPDWRLVFIGPVEAGWFGAKAPANLHFLGPKPYQELPAYVALFDVGLIPFCLTELTRDVNPVKLYEYFALGKPVVAARLPELVPYDGLCYLAGNSAEFVQQAEIAVADLQDPARQRQDAARRQALARANTWDERVAEITELLARHLAARQPG